MVSTSSTENIINECYYLLVNASVLIGAFDFCAIKLTDLNYKKVQGLDGIYCKIQTDKRNHVTVKAYNNRVLINHSSLEIGEYDLENGDTITILNDGEAYADIIIQANHIRYIGKKCDITLSRDMHTVRTWDSFPEYMLSPRIIKTVPKDKVEIRKPATKAESPKGEVLRRILPPICTVGMTIAVGILMKRGIYILMSVGIMMVTVVFSIVTAIQNRINLKKKNKLRVRNYKKYLLSTRKKLYSLKQKQIEAMKYQFPSIKDISTLVEEYSDRIYERRITDADFLTVAIGYTDVKPSFSVSFQEEFDKSGVDDLYDEALEISNKYMKIEDMPLAIDLKRAHLGIVGERDNIHKELQAIITQICVLQSYHDVEIVLFTDDDSREDLDWLKNFPQFMIHSVNVSGFLCSQNHAEQVLASMTQILKDRKNKMAEDKKDTRFVPHYIFVLDNQTFVKGNSIMEYLQSDDMRMGFTVLYSTDHIANLPVQCKTVIEITGKDNGLLRINEGVLVNKEIKLEDTSMIDLERIARKIAALNHIKGMTNSIPESISFFDLYGVKKPEELPIKKLWDTNTVYKSLAVPLGVRAKDDIVYLDIHEKAHGPHGLVAGTTGSGKSELLQSWILSLAVNFHPYDVGFLLIDYKGGGMANLFRNLPHLMGTITNLDGAESMRALASIKAELSRRQKIFAEVDVNNINDYTKLFKSGKVKLPLPHLLIISDEFAELKHEQPEFMAELVSTARIGRSLGVHLILATQKPSGVVDDQIWSNSKFKLALKVQNAADSNEVIKTPDAAQITQPGRAILQVGNNEIYEMFQSAWSGKPYSDASEEQTHDDRIYIINELGQRQLINAMSDSAVTHKDNTEVNMTELDVTVDYINSIYSKMDTCAIDKPWLPPLSDTIVTQHIKTGQDVGLIEDCDLKAPLGILDVPEEQKQEEYIHDFEEDGNLAVFGSAGYGKSVVMQNVALSLAVKNSPERLRYYILDYGNSSLIQLSALPHTADYLTYDDDEKLTKLIKLLSFEMKNRKQLFAKVGATGFKMYNEVAENKLAAIIVFIDNYDVVKELEIELEAFVLKLTRDGAGIGIFMVASASRTGAMRYAIYNNFKDKIALYMFDQADINTVVGRSNYKLPEKKGRALVKTSLVSAMQCFLPVSGTDMEYASNMRSTIASIAEKNTGKRPDKIRIMPDSVTLQMITDEKHDNHKAYFGLDTENVIPQALELFGNINTIVGLPQTGKTNCLRLILEQIPNMRTMIIDSTGGDLKSYKNKVSYYLSSSEDVAEFQNKLEDIIDEREQGYEEVKETVNLREYALGLKPWAILIDDADRFVQICEPIKKEMSIIIPKLLEYGVSIVLTTLPNKLRGYDEISKLLKDSQSGVVLGDPNDQTYLKASCPRGYKAQIDMGFICVKGTSRVIKIPEIGGSIND